MAERRFERTLLIDADDTLWENNIFYLRCTVRFQDFMESLGFSRENVSEVLDLCEAECVRSVGYGPRGYITALGMTCERLLRQRDGHADPALVEKARSFGKDLLSPPVVLIAEVEATLEALHPTSRLVLVTKGDEEVQRQKLERSGLATFFDARYIVPEKEVGTYRRIVSELSLDPHQTWMVGNSPKSDINPAIEAGLGAIFIPHNHTWTAERTEIARPELVVTLRRFADLLHFFEIELLEG